MKIFKILFSVLFIALPLGGVFSSCAQTDDAEALEQVMANHLKAMRKVQMDHRCTNVAKLEPFEPVMKTDGVLFRVPAKCDNVVVAHRGGAKEAGSEVPDNSIASLRYSQSLGCYAAECDIYITDDYQVIVAHADSDGKVNGLYPFRATLDEIREAGTLSNGEEVPTLQDYLRAAMIPGSCTRLWLDIKNITKPQNIPFNSVSAFKKAVKIIEEMQAQNWVEFICTGNDNVMTECWPIARSKGLSFAWMGNRDMNTYAQYGINWVNLDVTYMNDATHSGGKNIEDFNEAGIELSVYNVDKEKNMRFYIERLDKMKAICTNYPALLLSEMGKR